MWAAFGAELRLVDGRRIFGFILFAFFNPDVHHSSRSREIELLELFAVLIELPAIERSRAFRSLRSPTFSVVGSVQDKSAENMMDEGPERAEGDRARNQSIQVRTSEKREIDHELGRSLRPDAGR